ncbi:PorT family protein [Marivirga sp. S37H4]|uniref:PorT family protein n=1 Tax=Marivirga aurantiaca TaxID=2802615 RepID=A0A935CBM9_9BACT|nr:outer membrane beta-barrel protein [Marivirga aurantiaca]MBK6267174.1 PorT family protein [Marivirga aurantiaca]
MKRRNLLFNRTKPFIFLLLIGMFSISSAEGQTFFKKKKKRNLSEDFLKTQWWLGIRGGINFTNAQPITRYSGFNPINYSEESLEKEYKNFENPGFQMGLDITFYHAGFSIATFPSFYIHNIGYESNRQWEGETEFDRYETNYAVDQSITFIDLPVAVKYDILQHKVRPFVMAGAFYSFKFASNKEVNIRETDYASGSPQSYDRATLNLNNPEEFMNNWGVLGGAGVSFDFWNIRTILDLQYRHSFRSVVNSSERFKESEFSAFGEVQDDYSLQNYSGSISFVFPLRYIDSQFKAL